MKVFLVISFLLVSLSAQMKVYVSHSSKIESITLQELKNLYLKKTKLLKEQKVIVYDNKDVYNQFYIQFIQKTDGQIHAYWMKQIFSGKRIPPQKTISSEIVKILNANQYAISYSEVDLDAKVIYENK